MFLCVLGKSIPHGTAPVYYNFAGASFCMAFTTVKQEYRNKGGKITFFALMDFNIFKIFY